MLKYVLAFGIAATPCLAQQGPTPNEQALGTKLMQEMQEGLSCSTNMIVLRADLVKARARIAELEGKPDQTKEK